MKQLKERFEKLPAWMKKKYFLTTCIAVIWIFASQSASPIVQFQLKRKIQDLKEQQSFYVNETARLKKELKEMADNPAVAEKIARERYFMKRDNEDVFIITE